MEINLVTGIGIIFAIIGLGMLFNIKRYARMYPEVNKGVYPLYLGGFMALIFGLVVTSMNTPVDLQTWIVAVLGWLGILKGAVILIAPGAGLAFTKIRAKKGMIICAGIVSILVAIALLYPLFL